MGVAEVFTPGRPCRPSARGSATPSTCGSVEDGLSRAGQAAAPTGADAGPCRHDGRRLRHTGRSRTGARDPAAGGRPAQDSRSTGQSQQPDREERIRWISSSTRASSTSPAIGIPISPGGVADTVDEAVAQAEAAGYPVVVKAQVKVGGRGKAGGVKLAADADEVRTPRRQHPRPRHQGPRGPAAVGRARLGHRQGVLRQLHPRPGGQEAPRHAVGQGRRRDRGGGRRPTPTPSPCSTSTRSTASTAATRPASGWTRADLDPEAREQAAELLVKLYRCYVEGDCDLAEINPLILTPDGQVHALDAKVTLDDNAAFRHPEWDGVRGTSTSSTSGRRLAKEQGPQVHRPRRLRSASSPTAPAWP